MVSMQSTCRWRICRSLLLVLVCSLKVSAGFTHFLSTQRIGASVGQLNAAEDLHVALTREDGKNGKLRKAILERLGGNFELIEIPCIAHADGNDFALLEKRLSESWDFVSVTSPEAARVLSTAWNFDSPLPVAAVGKATEKALKDLGIEVSFCPSRALASVLVEELPGKSGDRVLYPASAKAKKTLEDGLTERGFDVLRLNTYDTVTATWTSEQSEQAKDCRVVCFGSPSAVEGWLKNTDNGQSVIAACIGKTSADACRDFGWSSESIFYPEKPGIDGWVTAVGQAATALQTKV